MRAWINDALRAAIGISLRIAGALFQASPPLANP